MEAEGGMTVLDRYLIREITRFFSLIYLGVCVIFIVVDYLSNMDEFLGAGMALSRAFGYVLLKLPGISVQLFPTCLLLSVLVSLGIVNRSNELVALKGGGISPGVLLRPVVGVAVVCCLLAMVLAEGVAPLTMARANAIKYGELRKSAVGSLRKENIWIRQDRAFIHINRFNSRIGILEGVRIREMAADRFRLQRSISAKTGHFTENGWRLEDVVEKAVEAETGKVTFRRIPEMVVPVKIRIGDFERTENAVEEMGIFSLWRYIQKIRSEGYDATGYVVDLFGKTAFPFSGLVLSLLAIWIALRPSMHENLPGGVGLGIGAAFLYWVFYSFSLSLGKGELLPPALAAWIPNLAFAAFGTYGILSLD